MKPVRNSDGTWMVEGGGGYILSDNMTNAAAWRYIDKANGEYLNKQEAKTDWLFTQQANSEQEQ